MPRQSRLDAPGVLHHVMIRGIERRRIFKDDKDRDNLLGRLSLILTETKTSCYAFALMPNHAHFLLRSGDLPQYDHTFCRINDHKIWGYFWSLAEIFRSIGEEKG